MTPQDTKSRQRFVDTRLRLATPDDVDPDEVPYVALWERTEEDPDPTDSLVVRAFDAFVAEVAGHEDAFWTALHWASGEVPTSAAVPAPPGRTERLFIWDEDDLFGVSAAPADGVRLHFPPGMPPERRVAFIRHFTRMMERWKETELAEIFREPVSDYRTLAAWRGLRNGLADADEDLGAVALFWVADRPE